jgi:guanylate kinase
MNRGRILVISGPSGSGKSSIINYLLAEIENAVLSVSTTSREMRKGEVDGIDYNFVSKNDFQQLINEDKFLEYEEVHGNFYGTRKDMVEDALEFGKLLIFDVDTRGKISIDKFFHDITVSIFITTPSKDILEERLRKRGTESEEKIQIRLKNAVSEMEYLPHFDYFIVNDDLEKAKKDVLEISKLVEFKPSKSLTKALIEIWAL